MKRRFLKTAALAAALSLLLGILAGPGCALATSNEDRVSLYDGIRSVYDAEAPRQALVQDTGLYEKMVHGRYYDLWDRNSLYFTSPELYSFENVLTRIREDNAAAAWIADNIGANALKQKADDDNYIRILLMLIVMQSQGFSQAGKTLSDYDTLKAFPEYTEDFVKIGLDVVSMGELSSMEELGFSLVDAADGVVNVTVNSLAEYEMYRDAADNYNNAYLLLTTIRKNTDDKELQQAVDRMLPLITEARNLIFGGDIGSFMVDTTAEVFKSGLFVNALIAFMEESAEEFAKDMLPFVKTLKSVATNAFIPGYSIAKVIYKSMILTGDLLFGTTNTYNRYAEMKCLSAIADALRRQISSYGYIPAYEKGSIKGAQKAVPLMEFYLLTCMRGEYCVEELVLNDGGVLTSSLGTGDNPSRGEIEKWFDTKNEVLSQIYGDVDRILCTGNEIYYRYLEQEIIPDAKWAKTGTMTWQVASLVNSEKGDVADRIAEYKDEKTGETGTGVVSAIVRDFDGDDISDMLVIFLDTAPIGETAIAPVYKKPTESGPVYKESNAIVLRAKLYTMQYNARPDEEEEAVPSQHYVLADPDPDSKEIPSIRKMMLENMSRWAEINAESWRMIDRYTVVETDSIEIAAEFYGLGYGNMTAGLFVLDDVLYFYTREAMDDYTTFGPSVYRTWHVEEGRFVFDNASRSVGWGQASYKINLGDNGTSFGELEGSLESGILLTFTSEITDYSLGAPKFTTVLTDRSFIRTVLEEGEGRLRELRGEDPVRTRVVNVAVENASKDKAKMLAEEIASLSGVGLTLSQEAEPQKDGSYWVRYVSANQTKVYILVDMDGNVKKISIDGTFAERYGEWTKVKDAALSCERLGLDSGIRSEFAGGDCSSGTREDYDWGYVMAGNMNTVFIWIEWNEPLMVYGE
ncbi:MAG: hypothetical protein J5889_06215 [Clostridia bacterium]|nr:hypothetical protein [Clostridia bacterium]